MPSEDTSPLDHYLARLKRDPEDTFACAQVVQHYYRGSGADNAWVRLALLTLLKVEPHYFLSGYTRGLETLSPSELPEAVRTLSYDDPALTAQVRARLLCQCPAGPRDRIAFRRLALESLLEVAEAERGPAWYDLYFDCLLKVDFERFVRELPLLQGTLDPGRCSFHLLVALEKAAEAQDWALFARLRTEYEHTEQRPGRHRVCECKRNDLANWEGGAALMAEDIPAVRAALLRAVEVRNCAHLASFGASVFLVEMLSEQGILLEERRAYLNACLEFCRSERVLEALERLGA